MSPRTKTAPDDEIIETAARVLMRVGPAHFRLADVAAEVGLAPATLIQRFQSKRNLLLAVADAGIQSMKRDFAARRARAASPLDAITEVRACVSERAANPQALAHSLAFMQLGLTDPDFHEKARAHQRALQQEVGDILRAAIDAGELQGVSPAPLARAIVSLFRGSLLTWAFHREGDPSAAIREELAVLLGPYRVPAPNRARTPKGADRTARRPSGAAGRAAVSRAAREPRG